MVKYTLRKTKITNIIWGIDLKNLLIIASTLAVLGGCGDKAVETPVETASSYLGDCAGAPGETPLLNTVDRDDWGSAGLDLAAMDKRFAPGDDFFCYVNGLWYANIEMPDDKTSYGSFTVLSDKSEARVKTII